MKNKNWAVCLSFDTIEPLQSHRLWIISMHNAHMSTGKRILCAFSGLRVNYANENSSSHQCFDIESNRKSLVRHEDRATVASGNIVESVISKICGEIGELFVDVPSDFSISFQLLLILMVCIDTWMQSRRFNKGKNASRKMAGDEKLLQPTDANEETFNCFTGRYIVAYHLICGVWKRTKREK